MQTAATCASDSRQHVSVPRLDSVSCASPAVSKVSTRFHKPLLVAIRACNSEQQVSMPH